MGGVPVTVLHREHPVQLVRDGKDFIVRVFSATDVHEVFRSRRHSVAREQYDIERHYRCQGEAT
jgi:hypothetical protein